MRAITTLAAIALLSVPARAGDFRFGRAALTITPTAETGGVKKVLDELYVKAVVFERDGSAAAIAVCDLPVIHRAVVDAARARIAADQPALPAARVTVSTTHSHTALVPGWSGPSRFDDVDPAQSQRYTSFLAGRIAEAVKLAWLDLKPASVSAAVGREESLVFNRRFLMKDGAVRFNPGLRNAGIVRTVGPTDPDVGLAVFEAGGKPLAALVNYALHLDTVGGNVYSADYPYTLGRLLAAVKGPDMLTVFTIGTAGNINHLDVTQPGPQRGPEEAARIGTILAAAVLKAWPKREPVEVDSVRVVRETVPLPPVELQPGEPERARAWAAREKEGQTLTLLERVSMQRILFAEKQAGRPLDVELMAIALGRDLAWVSMPGEVFVELGMMVKKGSPFRFTVVNELAYDWIRYVPNRKGYAEGAYEAMNTRCGSGCGEVLADAAVRCLIKLRGGSEQTPD